MKKCSHFPLERRHDMKIYEPYLEVGSQNPACNFWKNRKVEVRAVFVGLCSYCVDRLVVLCSIR